MGHKRNTPANNNQTTIRPKLEGENNTDQKSLRTGDAPQELRLSIQAPAQQVSDMPLNVI